MRALTVVPCSSKSCSSRAFLETEMASSRMSSGKSAGQSTLAYIEKELAKANQGMGVYAKAQEITSVVHVCVG